MYQGTQKRAPQGASEYRQVSLPQSKLIPSIIQPTGRMLPLGSGLNGSFDILSETKWPANQGQPGYSGLFRDKNKNIFFSRRNGRKKAQVAQTGRSLMRSRSFLFLCLFVHFRGQLISCFLVLFSDWLSLTGAFRSVLLGFVRFGIGDGGGFLPRVSFHAFQTRFFNCTHLYSAVLTYSHIKKTFLFLHHK